jgi:hypothetical protein
MRSSSKCVTADPERVSSMAPCPTVTRSHLPVLRTRAVVGGGALAFSGAPGIDVVKVKDRKRS